MLKKKLINDFERSSSIYFNEIGSFKPLTKEEEMSLWEKYKKNNDISARDKIIKSNLKFVANVAKPYIGMGLSYSDLIAEGNCGLMKALEKFDYTRGFKTISYSVWWIKQAIREALVERNGMDADDLPCDFEKPIENDDESMNDYDNQNVESIFLNEENDIDQKEKSELINMLLSSLTSREKYIVQKYYGLNGDKPLTLEEIGVKLKLTKERIRQILEKILKKMRSEALIKTEGQDIYI